MIKFLDKKKNSIIISILILIMLICKEGFQVYLNALIIKMEINFQRNRKNKENYIPLIRK